MPREDSPSPAGPGSPTDAGTPETGAIVHVAIAQLAPDPFQPRTHFSEDAIQSLAESIHQHGVLQPLLVRPMQGPNSRGKYWIVAGERRYRAAQTLGMTTLPCRVQPYENMAAAVIALAENVHRQDLSEIDKAAALYRIKTLTGRTWDEVAELVKLSRDYVKRLAGLLRLEPSVQEQVQKGIISVRTAIALRPLDARRQVEMAERVVREKLTAEQVREAIAQRRNRRQGKAETTADPTDAGPAARPKTVSGLLDLHTEEVRRIDTWIDARDWAPSRVSERQRASLDRLAEAASLLQQHLLVIRQSLREAEEPEAEKLRRADLPF